MRRAAAWLTVLTLVVVPATQLSFVSADSAAPHIGAKHRPPLRTARTIVVVTERVEGDPRPAAGVPGLPDSVAPGSIVLDVPFPPPRA